MPAVADRTARSLLRAGAGVAAAVGLGWAGYAAVAWSRYGRARRKGEPDVLLDRFLPVCEVCERHEITVRAPAAATWQAASELDFRRSAVIQAIFRGRELLMSAPPGPPRQPRPFLDEILALGWRVLAEEPGREMVFGAVTQPWRADVRFRGLSPEAFAGFEEPGYARIAWSISVEPAGAGASIFRTETRVATTDPDSRARFRRYWAVYSPGIVLIRLEMLRLVKGGAEGRRQGALARPSTSS
jgi:hypothetical protein